MGKDQELLEAARRGDLEAVERIIAQKNKKTSNPLSSLRRGPGANVKDSTTGYTPLHYAAYGGYVDIVRTLLNSGAQPSTPNNDGMTPLHLAAWVGRTEVVQCLLCETRNPVNVDSPTATKSEGTALHCAAWSGHAAVVALLLRHGADPWRQNAQGESALDIAAANKRVEVVKTLLQARPELVKPYCPPHSTIQGFFDDTPLHRAARNGDEQIVCLLLSRGVDVNIRTRGATSSGTALHDAAVRGKAGVVRALLDRGASTDLVNASNRTVLEVLRQHKAPVHDTIRSIIQRYRQDNMSCDSDFDTERHSSSDLDNMLPTQTNKHKDHSINKTLSSSLIKVHSNNFVKKITSKCLGLKAKFNSAPNISNSDLGSEIEIRNKSKHSPVNNRARFTSGFHIGNSKFFQNLTKKSNEPIDCNDEFDTISLDRVVIDRGSVCNKSNRSYPGTGFKASLPNISENIELSDSEESDDVLPTASNSVNQACNEELRIRSQLPHTIPESEPIDNNKLEAVRSVAEEYVEAINPRSIKSKKEIVAPPRRQHSPKNVLYENVVVQNKVVTPKPSARKFINTKHSDKSEEPNYVNIPLKSDVLRPMPAKRSVFIIKNSKNTEADNADDHNLSEVDETSIPSSTASSMSLDTKEVCSNFEDILMSKKSKSFRKPANLILKAPLAEDEISDSSSDSSSVVGALSNEEGESSSEDETKQGGYVNMSKTIPRTKEKPSRKLFRNVTFSLGKKNIEHLVNYHIRGTGHCIYSSPTVKEFIYVFNKEALVDENVSLFSKVAKDKDAIYDTAICFCRPNERKLHKSADDLTSYIEPEPQSPKVTLDIGTFRSVGSTFRCYCSKGSCTLHISRRPTLTVEFHALSKSVSNPDLPSPRAVPLENAYAIVDLASVAYRQESPHDPVSRQTSDASNDTSLTFGALSEVSSRTLTRSSSGEGTLRGSINSGGETPVGSACLVASLDGMVVGGGRGCVLSGTRARWDEAMSEADALSVSSASSAELRRHYHARCNKISPTPPKKPPRRNLSVSPTHANSPANYDYRRAHARSQDDLDDLQDGKHHLKHGRSVDQYVDAKHSYSEYDRSPRVALAPKPRPSVKPRSQPVAITTMYENVVIKEQNPRRKLRRNPTNNYENIEPIKMSDRSSIESLLDSRSLDSSDVERYYEIPSSPTHYVQPPTPEHPPPSAKQAENSIHERIRPLSQEYKRRSAALRDSQTETEMCYLLRTASSASVASGATDRSANTDHAVEEYICDEPYGGLFKGSTTTLNGIGARPVPAERPKTLRKLKSVYDHSPTEGDDDDVRRRSGTTSSNHSGDKSLSILSPFDEQEEWAKISEIMASFGSKLVRESVFAAELEQEFTSRLGLSCSESSLSPSVASSVGHWLNNCGLVDYETLFIESGYDDVDFINGVIDENDLRDMGIEENERSEILKAVTHLPAKIKDISANHTNIRNNNSENDQPSVEDWLKSIGLDQYGDTFRRHLYVDMDRVRRIWEVELTAVLEIQKPGHRKRILASVSGQNNGPVNNMEEINADLNSLKTNIQQLNQDIKEKLPEPRLSAPGGETLKRSKKNRPAPQPPKPSDLEIRAPSELMAGVPGALKTQWRHQPFVLVSGAVTYVANYLGSTVVKELRGTESTKKSIQKLKKSNQSRDSPDIILSISYRGVKFLNTITRELVCEHEIRNIHCACQDADDLTHFAYITKDHTTKSHYCHVFCVATMDQATEVILTLGEAFEVAYQMALRENFTKNSTRVTGQAKTPTHDPMTTTNKEKTNPNHGRSHSITEIKLNGHQLKIAGMPSSLSNEDFQVDGSRNPRTPLLKAPIASTEEL